MRIYSHARDVSAVILVSRHIRGPDPALTVSVAGPDRS